jgi:predicted nucleic acid-binding protein
LEVLTKPLQQGDALVEGAFRAVLFGSPDVQLRPISRAILERAARLRAAHGLKSPDAIHAATALERGCGLFITNDPAFRRVAALPVIALSDLLAP